MTNEIFSLPSPSPKRVLILTADAGFGHRSAANAVAAALVDQYGDSVQIDIVNPLEDKRAPFFLRDSQSDYDKLVRNMPELYRFGFDASDSTVPAAIVEQALVVLLFEVMRDIVRNYRPDVILTTYPLYQAPLRAVITLSGSTAPLLVVITDLVTVHRLWFSNGMDLCFVPNEIVRELAISYGIHPDRVRITGIPVSPEIISDQRSPAELREELGLISDLLTVVAVGSRRVDRLVDSLNVLNHFGYDLQLVVVAGKDESLYRQFQSMEWHVPVKLFEYFPNVPTLMKAADWIICKAGGLVVTEALACGRPMMLVDVIPGQETGNANYVVDNGAGDLVQSSVEVLETTAHWLMNNGDLLRKRTENARKMGKPRSAYDIATVVWRAANRGSSERAGGTGRLRLIDFLSKNQVRWEDDTSRSENT